MGFFNETFDSLDELFLHQLKDLYDAEQQIADALPKMVEKATSPQLKSAFRNHLEETKGHCQRLERSFQILKKDVEREKCEAVAGLLKEGDEILKANGPSDVIDAGLIAAAQRIEHYEMAGYGTARTFAQQLGYNEVAQLLQQTLQEEKNADQTLTEVAEGSVNQSAQQAQA